MIGGWCLATRAPHRLGQRFTVDGSPTLRTYDLYLSPIERGCYA